MKNLQESLGMSTRQLKEQRVANFCKNLQSDAEFMIEQRKRAIRDQQDKLDNLLDIGETQTTSIATRLKEVNTQEMMKEVFQLSYNIKENERILKSMTEDYNELFIISKEEDDE